jgi:lichenan operon transcriptional antiterminator
VISSRQAKLLDYLARVGDWVTAAELADHVGVTPRSIRSYVGELKDSPDSRDVVSSSAQGYRLNTDAYAAYRARLTGADRASDTPSARVRRLLRRLLDDVDGLDVYSEAEAAFVSESTVESDLSRVRRVLDDSGLSLSRHGSAVVLQGSELDRRRMLSRLIRQESDEVIVSLTRIESEFGLAGLSGFKRDLSRELDHRGYFVNEYGINDVLLHVAIAVHRSSRGGNLPQRDAVVDPEIAATAATLGRLVPQYFETELDDEEYDQLAILLATRVLAPGNDRNEAAVESYLRPDVVNTVSTILAEASDRYAIDLRDGPFTMRLALHVQNLLARASERNYSRNPLTRSIKTTYALIYEVAVYVASKLQQSAGIQVTDDEIAYIAMHVGAHLEQQSRRTDAVTCALICPGYYDIHRLLRERIERELGDDILVTTVATGADPDWESLGTDLVLTTIPPSTPRNDVIVIGPFLTRADADAVRAAVARIRRHRRHAGIKRELLEYFDESLFFRNLYAPDEFAMIRLLGERMRAKGLVDDAYVEGAVERERMSSTAFTDTLAIPHAMAMTAPETAIAIVVNDQAMDWGDARVNVIAFIAFNALERSGFQAVFDQFVEVFSDRDAVLAITRRSTTFGAFIDELVHVFDS